MKKKIGIICLIIFVLFISISCIVLSIPTLNNEITDFQQYIEAIFMFISGILTLLVMIILSLVLLIKKINCNC